MSKLLNIVKNTRRTWRLDILGRVACSDEVSVLSAQQRCLSDVSTQRDETSDKTLRQSDNNDLSITDSCAQQINRVSETGSFLRVLVDSGGCSGFQYKFELDTALQDDDRVFERDGARVVIDEESLKMIRGSVIDYHQELIRSAFRVVSNPQAEHGCSCGASFTVKL